jgi:hypothetical protein
MGKEGNQSVNWTPRKAGTDGDFVFMLSIEDGRLGMEWVYIEMVFS